MSIRFRDRTMSFVAVRAGVATAMMGAMVVALACGRASFKGDTPSIVPSPAESPPIAPLPADSAPVSPSPTAMSKIDVRVESFPLAADGMRPTDFLWVVDDSSSMKGLLGKVKAGFGTLSADKFPPDSRMAVMYTLPADPADLTRRHPHVPQDIVGLEKAPGFLRFVRKASIGAYLSQPGLASGVAEQFSIEGCDAEWFAPGAKNALGQSCFDAAVQAPFQGVGCEAGLVALNQLLDFHTGPVFRTDADLNVIFVSDTHDPGCPSAALDALAPKGAILRDALKADSGLASVTFHAIAPPVKCEGNNEGIIYGTKYYEAADATGGVKIDVCTEVNYASVADRIAGTLKTYAVKLAAPGNVTAVLVDGMPAVSFVANGLDVTFRAAASAIPRKVEVRLAQ